MKRLIPVLGLVLGVLGGLSALHGLDLDGSSVSDVFERIHGAAPPDSDHDGDGKTYRAEALLGGDPNKPDLQDLTCLEMGTNAVRLRLRTVPGLRYQLQESVDLAAGFTNLAPAVIIVGDGGASTVEVAVPGRGGKFWRWAGIGAHDSGDGDALDDFEEFLLGTDRFSSDSEAGGGDGMPDDFEFIHRLDPLADDAGADLDGDGWSNLDEYREGTHPRLKDTDGDGTSDGTSVTEFRYDQMGRLTGGSAAGGSESAYSYDAAGNLESAQ